MIRTVKTMIACAAAFSAQAALANHHEEAGAPMVHADVIGLDGESLGMVMLTGTPNGVLVTADLKGLPEGEHGFHFHEKGICDPGEKFATAGGHFAAGAEKHGMLMEGGPHGGDMPNQHVGADGTLKTELFNMGVTLGAGPKSLQDADGSALVIHAGADDYKSQPSGDAGGRIACAVISAPK
jgi:Cu-Zn family superoxide dismutase